MVNATTHTFCSVHVTLARTSCQNTYRTTRDSRSRHDARSPPTHLTGIGGIYAFLLAPACTPSFTTAFAPLEKRRFATIRQKRQNLL